MPQDTLYTKYCNVPKAQVVICPNVGFFKDFNDPQSLLDPVFNGKNILQQTTPTGRSSTTPPSTTRWPRRRCSTGGPERDKAWGKIDDMVTQQAPAIPYLWDKIPTVEAPDVRGVVNEYSTSWTSTSPR